MFKVDSPNELWTVVLVQKNGKIRPAVVGRNPLAPKGKTEWMVSGTWDFFVAMREKEAKNAVAFLNAGLEKGPYEARPLSDLLGWDSDWDRLMEGRLPPKELEAAVKRIVKRIRRSFLNRAVDVVDESDRPKPLDHKEYVAGGLPK